MAISNDAHNRNFEALRIAAMASGNREVADVIISAEENANETVYVEKTVEADEWGAIAWYSISSSPHFTESAKVRKWYKAHGYTW
jgi:hypothetical protein